MPRVNRVEEAVDVPMAFQPPAAPKIVAATPPNEPALLNWSWRLEPPGVVAEPDVERQVPEIA